MKHWLMYGLICSVFGVLAGTAIGAQGPTLLSADVAARATIQRLNEQVLELQKQLTQCQVASTVSSLTDRTAQLQASGKALDAEVRKALGAKPDDSIDYATDPPTIKAKVEPKK